MSSLVFVDARIAVVNSVLAEIASAIVADVLDPTQDGLDQITTALAGLTRAEEIHIPSHEADYVPSLVTAC